MARKILLADDSVTAQNMGRKILADAGYEVITVNNGSAALKKIAEQHPDVIVLDVYMPGYSGLEVCQRLKEAGETSRIPVLLTVGKLEPFKPDEARRVRADGFIVKPFEASELLSALTKLEDKIVPHSETSKAGRFGRAATSLDDSRFDRTVAVDEDDGWKTRLRFPPKKKEKAENEEAPATQPAKEAKPAISEAPAHPHSEKKADDEKVDLAALAPAGLPKDVTAEEIAALAAAAARMKGKLAEEKIPPENAAVPSASTDERKEDSQPAVEPGPTPQSMAGPGPIYAPTQKNEHNEPETRKDSAPTEPAAIEVPEDAKSVEAKSDEIKSDEASSNQTKPHEANSEEKLGETPVVVSADPLAAASSEPAPEPAIMAAAPVSGSEPPRWTAVAVALAPEDSALSLEQEMQKAFAASAGTETSQTVSISTVTSLEAASTPTLPSSEPEPPASLSASLAEPEQNLSAGAATDLVSAAVNELQSMAGSYAAQAPAISQPAVSSETQAFPAPETNTASPESQESSGAPDISAEAAKSENAGPEKVEPAIASEHAVAETRATEEVVEKSEPVVEQPAAETVSPSLSPAPEAARTESQVVDESSAQPSKKERHHEPDLAESTAAAWASWKRVKESGTETESPASPAAAGDTSKPEDSPLPDTAAMAAAVGANSPVDETKPNPEDPDVASIVESVLADLRPKIVQEISRKLHRK